MTIRTGPGAATRAAVGTTQAATDGPANATADRTTHGITGSTTQDAEGGAADGTGDGAAGWTKSTRLRPVVEVWWAEVSQARDESAADLDEVEQGRWAAYRRDEDRARFLLGVTMVRRLLGARFSLPPAKVRLDRTCPDCGKPHGKVRAEGVELSVTHSGDLVGVAVTDHPVGLDVEKVAPRLDVDGVAQLALTPEEIQELNRYDGIEKVRAFMTYWTRKEAVVKATGEGLRADLRAVAATPVPATPVAASPAATDAVVAADAVVGDGMQVCDLPVAPDHVAALAVVSAKPPVVRTFRFGFDPLR